MVKSSPTASAVQAPSIGDKKDSVAPSKRQGSYLSEKKGRMPLRAREGIEENIKFLIIEVHKQVERTSAYLRNPSKQLLDKVVSADDYIDNLKTHIQRKSFLAAARAIDEPAESVDSLRVYDVLASNLERISDFCEKVVDQVSYIDRPRIREEHDFTPLMQAVLAGIDLIEKAVFRKDVRVALAICRAEHTLDKMYAKEFKQVLEGLKNNGDGEDSQSLITILFIAHYMERMGDSLLNIGESVLSAHLGERIKIGQLRTLEDSLGTSDLASQLGHLSMHAMGETKSGARVASVSSDDPAASNEKPRSLIFKEGKTKKLIEERDSIEKWEKLMPGLAPKIYSFHDDGENGAILFEYLAGSTFEKILFQGSTVEVREALHAIQKKLLEIWTTTRKPIPCAPRFLQQLSKRFDDVLAVHPDFEDRNASLAGMEVDSFLTLIGRLETLDETLTCPISVFIHGDFNLDNVIYNSEDTSVRFIDLHRSTMMDFVQDISVFLVSHFRLRFLDSSIRQRINSVVLGFHEFASEFAASIGDETFQQRLALGIARSMATSTRFVLDQKLSRDMFLRSRYLLDRLTENTDKQQLFDRELIREVLVD